MPHHEDWRKHALERPGAGLILPNDLKPEARLYSGQGTVRGSAYDQDMPTLYSLYNARAREFDFDGRRYKLACVGHHAGASKDFVVATCITPQEGVFTFPNRDRAQAKASLFRLGAVFFDEPLYTAYHAYVATRKASQILQERSSLDYGHLDIGPEWANSDAASLFYEVGAELEQLFGAPFANSVTTVGVPRKGWFGRERIETVQQRVKTRIPGVPNVIGSEVRWYVSEVNDTPAQLTPGRETIVVTSKELACQQ